MNSNPPVRGTSIPEGDGTVTYGSMRETRAKRAAKRELRRTEQPASPECTGMHAPADSGSEILLMCIIILYSSIYY